MSDIIIEGKNLSDINQSNFQTVGVRSALYFDTSYYANESLSVDEDVFKHDTIDVHLARLSPDPIKDLLPTKLIEVATIEPWQGRLYFDRHFSYNPEDPTESPYLGLFEGVNNYVPNWQPLNSGRPSGNPANPVSKFYYPYFYTGNLYEVDFENEKLTRLVVNNLHARIPNNIGLGVEERESTSTYVVKDDRFPLGTYTEENKQYWELQTSDPISRNSQFSSTRMQTAQSTKLSGSLIRSDEEQFSVDAFTFTERDGVITPLFFYYDKNLHPTEYNNATTGKVNLKIELRASGRNGDNELDLYQDRKVVRPFLLGLEKDEQSNGGFDLNDPPEELIGTGEIYGEGLYYGESIVTITAEANEDSYLLGIFDIPDDNLITSGTGDTGTYTFNMPIEDVQYLAKFRPNPYIIMSQRFTDEFGNVTEGTLDSKGEIRLWTSKIYYDNDEAEYYTVPIDDVPAFKTGGSRFIADYFRPLAFNGSPITIEQREVTSNYKFKGFTYLSLSGEEVPFSDEPMQIQTTGPTGANVTVNADQHYIGGGYGAPGNDEDSIKTIELLEDFYYPAGRFNIYANYGLMYHVIENLNNYVDFENNFVDALKYGPFKFITSRVELGDSEDFSSANLKAYPAFESNDGPIRRLLISAPGVGYVNTPTIPPIEEIPEFPPEGWGPATPMIGTLSPLEQWIWNGGGWEENPNYDPSNIQSTDYLPSGDNGHLTPIEETGFDFGSFVWHRLPYSYSTFPDDVIETPIFRALSEDVGFTFENAVNLLNEYPPTYDNNPASNGYGMNLPVEGTSLGPNDYSVGANTDSGIFQVMGFEEVGLDEQTNVYFWIVNWDVNPDLVNHQTFMSELEGQQINYYNLNLDEINQGYRGIQLKGIYSESPQGEEFLSFSGDNKINKIMATEITASISYQPLQRGVYVKVIDDGVISTFIERSVINSMTPIRPKELNGAIDADMEGFDRSVVYNMTPSQPSMPPQISAFVAQANGNLTNSTNIHPTLDLERLGVEWNPDDWSANGGGTFKYTAPESRDATYMAGDDEISLFWKYIEFRIVVQETADGEQSESGEAVDPSFYVGLNVFGMPGSGGQIFDNTTDDLVSTGGLINLFPIEGMVDENGIPYQEFSEIPQGQRSITLRAVPSAGSFAQGDQGTWSFQADPGVNLDTIGSITEFLNSDGHHIGIITFNEEGPITVSYSWFGDGDGGGF